MNDTEILEYAKTHGGEITGNEARQLIADEMNKATNSHQLFSLIGAGFDHFLADPKIRQAIRAQNKFAKSLLEILEAYGPPSNYVVISLHPESSADDILNVCSKLEAELKVGSQNQPTLLLLDNEEVIARHQRNLTARGFAFSPDWRSKESAYRVLLEAAKKDGKTYKMIRENSSWAYKEVTR